MPKVRRITAYAGPVDPDGTVPVYDLQVSPVAAYSVGGAMVSNSKRISLLDVNALLAHNAHHSLRDASNIRGTRNEDYWLRFMQGHTPPEPGVPAQWRKFEAQLKAAGANLVPDGPRIRLLAMTNTDVGTLAGDREIKNGGTVDWKDGKMVPIPGGLFDRGATGAHGGGQWSKYVPAEPMPSPIFEEPIKKLLGITGPQFEDIIAGRRELDKHGTGFGAIGKALDSIDIDRELARSRAEIASGRKSKRSDAISRLRYLKSAKAYNLHPRDWMLSAIPVLPPEFRPVSTMAGGTPLVDDANYLYAQMIDADKTLRGLKDHVGDGGTGEERLRLYDSFRQVTGLAAPSHPKLVQKKVTGFLGKVFGKSPKHGCFDTETEILTEFRGWVKRDGLDIDDRVATLNRETGAFEWQSILETHDYDYCGWMVSIKTDRALDVLVSPEHRNWARYRTLKSGGADNIETGWDFEEAYKTAAAPLAARAWFRTAASGWVGSWNGFPKFLGEVDRLKFAEFVGWWVAEGNISERDKSIVQLSQSPVKNAAKCAMIQKCVDAIGLPVSCGDYMVQPPKGPKVRMRSWSIKSKPLAQWFQRHCGELARGKFLSARVRSWPAEGLKAILVGYGGGDGSTKVRVNAGGKTHKNNTGSALSQSSTTSRKLVDSLQEIACKIGWTVRFSRNVRGNDRPIYRTYYSGSRFAVLDNAEKGLEWYDGKIWCVSVANEVVLVRRNGRPFFSGNSLQRRLLGTTVDNTGRGVITVNPDMDMDSVGLPKDAAYDVFQKFIARRLVRGGIPLSRALEEIKQRTPRAADALLREMDERPVLLTRAPVWHKYGIQAFRPRLTAHNVIEISPLVTKGFGADFDGDMQTFHVPSTDDAVREAYEKLLPSRNVIGPADRRTPMFQPTQDLLAGLVKATDESEASDRAPRHFATKVDVLRALASGDISHNDRVVVVGEKG